MNHFAKICREFIKIAAWWSGKKFRHPETKRMVNFHSLPKEEQKRLNNQHQKKTNPMQYKLNKQKQKDKNKKIRKQLKEEKFKNITKESHPNFFAEDGIKLDTTHGMRTDWNIVKNPNWSSEKDDSYYAYDENPETGRKTHYYTENYIKKHKLEKFANIKRFMDILPRIREKYVADLTSENERSRTYATAIALVDKGGMRIGNKKSEENDVRGLHNLSVKNISINGNEVKFSYTGKNQIEQRHKIYVDDVIKNNLLELIKDKDPDDSIFTFEKLRKQKRISPKLVNAYLRFNLRSNVTVHKFRHANATRIAKEYLDKIDLSKVTLNDMKIAMNDSINEVADFLGNTAGISKQYYINPVIFKNFLKKGNFKVKLKDVLNIKTASNSFTFNVDSSTNLTKDEEYFKDDINEIKLEDLDIK